MPTRFAISSNSPILTYGTSTLCGMDGKIKTKAKAQLELKSICSSARIINKRVKSISVSKAHHQ